MSDQVGILGFGAYVPRRRLHRSAIHAANAWYAPELRGAAKGEKAIGNWDEDPVTMAVEAGRDCLTGVDRSCVDSLCLASTTLPNADRSNAGIVKEALTLRDHLETNDCTGSQKAATSALLQALSSTRTSLVIASDQRLARAASAAEMAYGEAAAGVLVGTGDVIARCIARHSVALDFVDHFRGAGARFDYDWESRWIRDEGYVGILGQAIADALKGNGLSPGDIDHSAIAIGMPGVATALTRAARLGESTLIDNQMATVGNSGAAYPLMLLVAALEKAKPGERILLASFGQGADVLVFEVTEAIIDLPARRGLSGWLAERREDTNYQRYLFHRGILEAETGMRAEIDHKQPGTTLYRQRKSVLGLVGGRCRETGVVQFPRSEVSIAQNSREVRTQEDYPMAELPVTIFSYTADRLGFSPDPPTYYGNIDFKGGGRMTAEFTDVMPEDVDVGREMRMVFRIKAKDELRGFTKYFWKAAPMPRAPGKGT